MLLLSVRARSLLGYSRNFISNLCSAFQLCHWRDHVTTTFPETGGHASPQHEGATNYQAASEYHLERSLSPFAEGCGMSPYEEEGMRSQGSFCKSPPVLL